MNLIRIEILAEPYEDRGRLVFARACVKREHRENPQVDALLIADFLATGRYNPLPKFKEARMHAFMQRIPDERDPLEKLMADVPWRQEHVEFQENFHWGTFFDPTDWNKSEITISIYNQGYFTPYELEECRAELSAMCRHYDIYCTTT